MNSHDLVEEKLKAPDEGGSDPGGGHSSPNLVEAMNSQHLVEEKLKAPDEGGPDPKGGQSSPNLVAAMNSKHLKNEGRTWVEDRTHQIWWRP